MATLPMGCGRRSKAPSGSDERVDLEKVAPIAAWPISPAKPQPLPRYPWDWRWQSPLPIGRYHFRCKGSSLRPRRQAAVAGGDPLFDCDGEMLSHSLPLFEGEEGVYPCLIELLNYLQAKTGRAVVITSGHRCPSHNTYIDSSVENQVSKHQIGAAVDFYMEGYENSPEKLIELIGDYYREQPEWKGDTAFFPLQRWTKESHGVSCQPWYNRELFIKLYRADEGRNDDNCHPWPYLSLQVRWDRLRRERVEYSWKRAFYGYYRF